MRENPLLEHIASASAGLPPGVTIPPGDDMGAITLGEPTLLVTVDQLAAGVHIDLGKNTLQDAGRKAVRRSLSDIAAMGCTPVAAVATACLPSDIAQDDAARLADAMREDAARFGCPLIGGDVATWQHPMLLTVTAFAQPTENCVPLLRSSARPGHAICVTGQLGGSLIDPPGGLPHHLAFTPRIDAGRALATLFKDQHPACMDLSDGLAADLPRLCAASNVSAEIDAACLPLRGVIAQAAEPWRAALGDGEDYELLFTLPPEHMPDQLAGVPVTVIGSITESRGPHAITIKLPDGSTSLLSDLGPLGWEHGE